VLGLYEAHDNDGRPLFKRTETETPSSLAALIEDTQLDTTVYVYDKAEKELIVYNTLKETGIWY
jgi:hypothetical protein